MGPMPTLCGNFSTQPPQRSLMKLFLSHPPMISPSLTSPPTLKAGNIVDLTLSKHLSQLQHMRQIRPHRLTPSKWNKHGWKQPTGTGAGLRWLQITSRMRPPPLYIHLLCSSRLIPLQFQYPWRQMYGTRFMPCRKEWSWLLWHFIL